MGHGPGSKFLSWAWALLAMLSLLLGPALAQAQDKVQARPVATIKASMAKTKAYDAKDCYECHEAVKGFHVDSAHKTVGCDACHGGLDTHRPKGKGRPTTNMDPANCGTCHQNQFRTMYTMNLEKTAHKDKTVATFGAMDKILAPHGFTREHNEPRSHAFALYDQVVVDRAFGGRFQNKEGKAGPGPHGRQLQDLGRAQGRVSGRAAQGLQAGHGSGSQPGVHVMQVVGPYPGLGLPG